MLSGSDLPSPWRLMALGCAKLSLSLRDRFEASARGYTGREMRRALIAGLGVQDELVRVGMSEMLIGRCLHYLQQQGDVELVRGRRMIHRIR